LADVVTGLDLLVGLLLLQRRIKVFISKIIDWLREPNEGQRVGGVLELGDDWWRCQRHASVSLHVDQVSHRIDGILQATLRKWMIPIESGTLELLQHLFQHGNLFMAEWLAAKLSNVMIRTSEE